MPPESKETVIIRKKKEKGEGKREKSKGRRRGKNPEKCLEAFSASSLKEEGLMPHVY